MLASLRVWTHQQLSNRCSRGEAKLTTDVNAGVVVATLGYWRQLNRGTVNAVSAAEFVDMGHAPTFSDNLVEVARAG